MPGESGRVCPTSHGVDLQQDSLEGSVGSAAAALIFQVVTALGRRMSQRRRLFNVEAFLMTWSPQRDACLVPVSSALSFGMSEAITTQMPVHIVH